MFLGLRKTKGVSVQHFINKFGRNPLEIFYGKIEQLKEQELIKIEDNYISLTHQGRFLGNEVFQAFLYEINIV